MEVGVRELRANLSRYLKRVQAGEEILVTDRGEPVARITPANGRSKLEELIAAGIVTPTPDPSGWLPEERIEAKGSVSELVKEQRRLRQLSGTSVDAARRAAARSDLERLWAGLGRIEAVPALVQRAGDLADRHALRGYDAVHLAAFETVATDEAVLVTFDEDLRRAARASGLMVAPAR